MHVENLCNKAGTLLKEILIDVGTYLPEIFVHLDQATTKHNERKDDDTSVTENVAAIQ